MARGASKTKKAAPPAPPRRRGTRPSELAPPAPRPEVLPDEPPSFKAWEGKLNPTERIVDEIIQYMANGQWLGSVSEREVAKAHNLSPETIRRYSAEANRVLRRRLREDPELHFEARHELLHSFRIIRALAMKDATAGGLGVALNASRALGFYLGIEPARKHEHDVNHSLDEFAGWTEEEMDAFAKDGKRPRRALQFVAQQQHANGGLLTNGNADEDDDDDELDAGDEPDDDSLQ